MFWRALPPEDSRADLAALAGLLEWRAYPNPSLVGAIEEAGVRTGIKVGLVHLE